MEINSFCLTCLIRTQESQIRKFSDEDKKTRYMREVLSFLSDADPELSAPALVRPLADIYERYWGIADGMSEEKKEFNDYLLSLESSLEAEIRKRQDKLSSALCYARTANYIDLASVKDISKEKLLALFEAQEKDGLDQKEWNNLRGDLESASRLVYLADNCGEIVLDKIAVKIIQEEYPNLDVTVMVRGAPVLNDVDMEAARYVGIDQITKVVSNGSDIAGTELRQISPEARALIDSADLIISKGQGNFETLYGCGLNIYYLFLCKCDWFVQWFRAEKFQGMLVNERRVKTVN